METDDETPENIMRSWANGIGNVMTDNVEEYGWIRKETKDGYKMAYELSSGKFAGDLRWGVTVVKYYPGGLSLSVDRKLSGSFKTELLAREFIQKLQREYE